MLLKSKTSGDDARADFLNQHWTRGKERSVARTLKSRYNFWIIDLQADPQAIILQLIR